MFCVADRPSGERRHGEQCDEVTSSARTLVARLPPPLDVASCRAVAVFGVHRSSARTRPADTPALASARGATEGVQRESCAQALRDARAGRLATPGPRSRATGRLHAAGGPITHFAPSLAMTTRTISCSVDPAGTRRTGQEQDGVELANLDGVASASPLPGRSRTRAAGRMRHSVRYPVRDSVR
jgi:hypothetical protein